jgi:hypothetical protein
LVFINVIETGVRACQFEDGAELVVRIILVKQPGSYVQLAGLTQR